MNAVTPLLKPYGCPAGIKPHEWRRALQIRLDEILDVSMALITALDMMEVDPDFELNGDDEPSLGWTANGALSQPNGDDREGDDCDLEPSLGALQTVSQIAWSRGAPDEREFDNCDDEDGHDAEYDPAEWGVADGDALHTIMP